MSHLWALLKLVILLHTERSLPVSSYKISEFRSRKRTFEEALSSGDLSKDSAAVGCRPHLEDDSPRQIVPQETINNACPKYQEEPDCSPTSVEVMGGAKSLLSQGPDGICSKFHNLCICTLEYGQG